MARKKPETVLVSGFFEPISFSVRNVGWVGRRRFVFVTDIYKDWFCVSTRLRCPIKSSGLRCSSILSTAALKFPALHLPQAACREFDPTSYARRTHNTEMADAKHAAITKKKTPSGWMGFLFGCGGRTRTYDLRVMSPTSFQLLYSAILAPQVLEYYSIGALLCQVQNLRCAIQINLLPIRKKLTKKYLCNHLLLWYTNYIH